MADSIDGNKRRNLPNSQHEYQGTEAQSYEGVRATDAKWLREDDAVRELLQSASPRTVILDAPVGTGRFLPLYADRKASCVGIDVSLDMLRIARTRAAEIHPMEVPLLQADIGALPFQSRSFEVVVCVRLLNLVPLESVSSVLRELTRVTQGHLILGVRTYDALSTPYQLLARARRLGRHTPKLHVHPQYAIRELFATNGLLEMKAIEIHRGRHRSSVYRIYQLASHKP